MPHERKKCLEKWTNTNNKEKEAAARWRMWEGRVRAIEK